MLLILNLLPSSNNLLKEFLTRFFHERISRKIIDIITIGYSI